MAGGNPGFAIHARPGRYPTTPQQQKLRDAAEHCGIRKGMKREELVTAMKTCIPEFFKKSKGQETKEAPAP